LLDSGFEHVLAVRFVAPTGTMIAITNLFDEPCTIDLSPDLPDVDGAVEIFANRRYTTGPSGVSSLDLDGLGYRWLRVD
jgi:maltose alpha-D-glucosyltransferase/alpha-amylase